MSESSISLHQSLQAPRGTYVPATFESLMEVVAKENKIQIWCDRRIAKDTKIDLETKTETLENFLKRATEVVDGAVVPIDSVLLIIPQSKQTLVEAGYWRLSQSRVMVPLARVENFGWSEASNPSELLDEFSRQHLKGRPITPSVEFDLWKPFEFRKTLPAAISVCLLSGFDLSLVDQSGRLEIVEIDSRSNDSGQSNHVEWVYKSNELKRIGEEHWKSWRKRWPDAKVSKVLKAGDYSVQTEVAAHRDLVRPLFPIKKYDTKKPTEIGYTGQMKGELEIVIRSLAAKAKLDFYPLPLPPQIGSKVVDIVLNNSTIDDSLKLISKQSGLEFRRSGDRVEIVLPR